MFLYRRKVYNWCKLDLKKKLFEYFAVYNHQGKFFKVNFLVVNWNDVFFFKNSG